jgi:hypothetical protein
LHAELPSRICARAGYARLRDARIDSEFGSFSIARHQAEGLAGYCLTLGDATLAVKLGALWELSRRSNTTPDAGVGIGSARAASAWAGQVSLDVSYAPLQHAALFVSLNVLGLLSKSEFVAEGFSEPLLEPHRFRVGLDVGVAASLP